MSIVIIVSHCVNKGWNSQEGWTKFSRSESFSHGVNKLMEKQK